MSLIAVAQSKSKRLKVFFARVLSPLRVVSVIILLLALKTSFADENYIPLPMLSDGKLSLSSKVFLRLESQQLDAPIEQLLSGRLAAAFPELSTFIESVESRNPSLFARIVNAQSFSTFPIGPIDYYDRFIDAWDDIKDKSVFFVIELDDLQIVLFSGRYGSGAVYPLVCFKRNVSGEFRLVPDESSAHYQVVALWSSTLRKYPKSVISGHRLSTLGKAEGLHFYEFKKGRDKNSESRPMALVFQFNDEEEMSANAFLTKLKAESGRVLIGGTQAEARLFYKQYYSKPSAKYLAGLARDEQVEHVKNVSKGNPLAIIDMGEIMAAYIRREGSGVIDLVYLGQASEGFKVINVGRISPVDSIFLDRTLVNDILSERRFRDQRAK